MNGSGFAGEGLGQLLFHLSEFRLNSHRWIDEQDIVLPERVFSSFSVGHDLSLFPREGVPYLQLAVTVGIEDAQVKRDWWNILVNLGLDGDQNILCRLWTEALPSNPYGPEVASEIYRSSLPAGQDGVGVVESACKATFDQLKRRLPTLPVHRTRPSDLFPKE